MKLREVTPDELAKILERHKKWIDTEGEEGERADLRGANLRGATLQGANLQEANLQGANLQEANLDFSSLPLWCGGLHIKTDRRIMAQMAYHFGNQNCNDPGYLAARNAVLAFANTFHRAKECGMLERIEPEKEREENAAE